MFRHSIEKVKRRTGKLWRKTRTLLMHLIYSQKIGALTRTILYLQLWISSLALFMVSHGRGWWMLFEKKYTKEGKVVDISLLVLCNFVLILHIQWANYAPKMWKPSLTNWLDWDSISEKECFPDGSTYWVDDIFLRDVEEILCNSLLISDHFDKSDEQDQLPDDNSENYDDGNDE